jgi:hypothetical protein
MIVVGMTSSRIRIGERLLDDLFARIWIPAFPAVSGAVIIHVPALFSSPTSEHSQRPHTNMPE